MSKLWVPFLAIGMVVIIVLVAVFNYSSPQQNLNTSQSDGGLNFGSSDLIISDVPGASLQQAATPAGSTTQAELSPQQAQPNYCATDEIPYQDACVPR
jgi:hypothetical protein